jgi:tRNA 2-selenouridine synthase
MAVAISIDEFFNLKIPLVDVRTPLEFIQGHIPGAFNLPIFSNEERVMVGTTYKQQSREAAILLGFDLTGSKWSGFIRQALEIAPQKRIAVHCWRGGMRSGAMAWALSLYGFEVYIITGGYKNFRRWTLNQFERSWNISVLGGMTGSGKTMILKELRRLGEQIIDLEELAQHQGSSFGSMNKLTQPTQEQFENNLAFELFKFNSSIRLWVEDESVTIGKRVIPNAFFKQMRSSKLFNLITPLAQRISALVDTYGKLDPDFLIAGTERVRKRLGPEQTKHAVQAIHEGRMSDFISLLLVYYDKNYLKGIRKRDPLMVIPLSCENDFAETALKLMTLANDLPVIQLISE